MSLQMTTIIISDCYKEGEKTDNWSDPLVMHWTLGHNIMIKYNTSLEMQELLVLSMQVSYNYNTL